MATATDRAARADAIPMSLLVLDRDRVLLLVKRKWMSRPLIVSKDERWSST